MKILKRTGIIFAVMVALYLTLALFGSSSIHIERSTIIHSDASAVYNEINTLKQWKFWSYWDNIDPAMESVYSGPSAGVGAKHSWTSKNDSVGTGTLTITKNEPGKFIETELAFEDMGTSLGGWIIKDTTDGVIVTTYMDMEIPFLFRPMMMFVDMDEMLGSDFEKSLEGLRKHCEKSVVASRGESGAKILFYRE